MRRSRGSPPARRSSIPRGPKLVAVGTMALDDLKTPFGERQAILGGSATFFGSAAAFLTKVGVISVIGDDFPREHLDELAARGVDLLGVQQRRGKTFHWAGEYGADLNVAHTKETRLGVLADYQPVLPESYRRAPFVFLANVDPDIQRQVLDQARGARFVAADTMNFWISGKPDALRKVLRRVDLLAINEAEARQLSGKHLLREAVREIAALGPRLIVVKRGEYGALLFSGEQVFAVPAYPLEKALDPTGAGDSFAGGFMGYLAGAGRVNHGELRRAAVMGSVMASFAVESFGAEKFGELSPREIRKRYAGFQKLTAFGNWKAGPAKARRRAG